jgi:hypothetical protein
LLSLVNKVDDGNRLATSCSNKTNTKLFVSSCYELVVINSLTTNFVPRLSTRGKSLGTRLVNNLLRADAISFPEPAILGKEREALG